MTDLAIDVVRPDPPAYASDSELNEAVSAWRIDNVSIPATAEITRARHGFWIEAALWVASPGMVADYVPKREARSEPRSEA